VRRLIPLILSVCAFGALAPVASAAEPPNQNDPCSRAGRDSCGTTGVGRYATYRYGLRWFGDYRKAVTGEDDPTFCIDLRFWYPSPKFRYRERSTTGLKNKEGKRISATRLAYMNYALWKYGRSDQVTRQAATMLFVHHLMDDGAPGEIDPGAISPQIETTFNRISDEAKKYAGPYRVVASLPERATVGTATKLTVRVVSAAGNSVPGIPVNLDVRGVSGLPADLRTGSDGTLQVPFTPTAAGELAVTATANGLASETPKLYVPTRGEAARSGQRLVSAAGTARSTQATAAVAPAQVAVTTTATPSTLGAGGQSTDAVTITGAPAGWSANVEVRLYGPFPTREAIVCTGTPVATHTYSAGPGESRTPATTLTAPGYYGYQLTVPSSADVLGLTTPCVPDEEVVRVQSQPVVQTVVTSSSLAPGESLADTVSVSGLAGQTVTVKWKLFGPYPSADAMTCAGGAYAEGSFVASQDGSYVTEKVKLTVPGYYTYRESIDETGQVKGVETPCAEASETAIVRGTPAIRTQVSEAQTAPGSQLRDTAIVSGLGALKAEVQVELWGPYATQAEMRCEGTPFWTGTFTANGDGSYLTDPVTLTKAGFYTYRERILPSGAFAGVETACGEAAETTFTRAAPQVKTTVSDAVVGQKTSVADRLVVTGLGQTPATVQVELFGPFATRAEIRCTGTPYWKGTLEVAGDGEYDTEEVTVKRAGFYTFRERIAESPTIAGHEAACGEEAETTLAAPLIQTGRTAPPVARRTADPEEDARTAAGPRPTRVRLMRLGINADLAAVGIDTKTGELAVPKDISRPGWWKDGAAPGSTQGATLIAGHVDSAKRGAGAFYRLKEAKKGDRVVVTTVDGKERIYRVTTVKTVAKNRLPQSLFSRTGDRKLYLVTCGGPFNTATGHYRDNVVLTAVPL
jgi:LPXTG-site transpeptidase (sortase) family protein